MVAGKSNCTVECNPLIGPQLFDLVEAVAAGKKVPPVVRVMENVYDQSQRRRRCQPGSIERLDR